MELVYFGVAEHFLFEDCGFGLGSQFDITGEKGINKDLELTIKVNTNYIPDFFSNNVLNVTAIIGSNGSGKTEMLEILLRVLSGDLIINEKFLAIFWHEQRFKIVHTLYDTLGNKNYRLSNLWTIIVKNHTSFNYEEIILKPNQLLPNSDPFIDPISFLNEAVTAYYTPIVDLRNYPYNTDDPNYIDLSTNFLFIHDKKDSPFDSLDTVETHKLANVQRQLEYLFNNNHGHSKEISIPKTCNVEFCLLNISAAEKRQLSTQAQKLFEDFSNLGIKNFNNAQDKFKYRGSNEKKFKKAQIEIARAWFLYCFVHNFFYNLSYSDDYDVNRLGLNRNYFEEEISKNDLTFNESIKKLLLSQQWVKGEEIWSILEKIESVFYDYSEIYHGSKENVIELNLEGVKVLLSNYSNYINELNLRNSTGFVNFNWRNLSTGEKLQLDLFSRLYSIDKQVKSKLQKKIGNKDNASLKAKFLYLIIDEGEVGFHPFWQTQFLNTLINFLEQSFKSPSFDTNIKIQIILTSHSPFVISDLPTENVVLLEKNALSGGNTTIDKVKISKKLNENEITFGANIHTLLADSFFLKNNQIGEFAHTKIKDVVAYLNNSENTSNLNRNTAKSIIEMIGEPIIKNKLLEMYRRDFGEEDELNSLEERIKILQAQQEEIRKRMNKND